MFPWKTNWHQHIIKFCAKGQQTFENHTEEKRSFSAKRFIVLLSAIHQYGCKWLEYFYVWQKHKGLKKKYHDGLTEQNVMNRTSLSFSSLYWPYSTLSATQTLFPGHSAEAVAFHNVLSNLRKGTGRYGDAGVTTKHSPKSTNGLRKLRKFCRWVPSVKSVPRVSNLLMVNYQMLSFCRHGHPVRKHQQTLPEEHTMGKTSHRAAGGGIQIGITFPYCPQ